MHSSEDSKAEDRKRDHIQMAFASKVGAELLDSRFYYEPILASHPDNSASEKIPFSDKYLRYPVWVSSMTGGTAMASKINANLAQACKEFGFGMGLGSCRQLLSDNTHFADFNVRKIMGEHLPLYANLGIAQLEQIVENKQYGLVKDLIDKLNADGLIIHVNPLQEALQPEGDAFKHSPLYTIMKLLDNLPIKYIVKEVGQGMGPASLDALCRLPLEAIEFAAAGGTNFSKLELMRRDTEEKAAFDPITRVGHTALEMVHFINDLKTKNHQNFLVKQLIISGGVSNFLDGFFLIGKSMVPAVYGQASSFLRFATEDYAVLQHFISGQIQGLKYAQAFLKIK